MSRPDAPDPARFRRLWCKLPPPHHEAVTQLLLSTLGQNPCPWQDECPQPLLCLDTADAQLACTCPRPAQLHHDTPTPACRCRNRVLAI